MQKKLLILGTITCLATVLIPPLEVLAIGGLTLEAINQKSLTFQGIGGQQIPLNTIASKTTMAMPVKEILPQLKGKTEVPIFIPSQLPISAVFYFTTQPQKDGYTISIGYAPNCDATACLFGGIGARKGGEFITAMAGVTKTWKNIVLAKGVKGIFHNGCGAYCTATVEWKNQGVLYSVNIKNGREEDTIAIANSAIQAGPR